MPWVFVLIWATGFVVARFGMPHSPPMSFLALCYALSLLCFVGWIALAGVEWPRGREQWFHLAAVGVLIHAAYLGGVWSAVKAGIGAGTVALLAMTCSMLADRATWLPAVVAGAAAVAAYALPLKLNMLVAIAAAVAMGSIIDHSRPLRRQSA